MFSNIIYPQGQATISVPATEKIAVSTRGTCDVSQVVGYPNHPTELNLLSAVSNAQYVSSAFSAAATVIVENTGAAPIFYQVGSDPVVIENYNAQLQPTPTAKTTAATLTIEELLTGILTGTHTVGGTAAYTLPTGTLTDAGLELAIGESFDWTLINLSAAALDTITITAGTGHTLVGTGLVQSVHSTTGLLYGSSGRFRTRKTAANTFVTYRMS